MAVLATALLVTVLGLSGLIAVGVQRRESVALRDRIAARILARSATQLALARINQDPNWRTTYPSGIESVRVAMGDALGGAVSWIVADDDGSLSDPDSRLTLRGIGRVGNAVQVSGVEVVVPVTGPAELRSMTTTASAAQDSLRNDEWWCQYVKPTLPATALSWRITSVEFHCRRKDSGQTVNVVIYETNGSNMPSSTVIDSMSVNSSSLSSGWSWQSFALSGSTEILAGEGVCVALTTSANNPIDLEYISGGLAQADSALITGDPTWSTYESDKALRYRLHGVYTLAETPCTVVERTWTWDAAP